MTCGPHDVGRSREFSKLNELIFMPMSVDEPSDHYADFICKIKATGLVTFSKRFMVRQK